MGKLSQPISSFTSQYHSMVIIWQTTKWLVPIGVSLYRKPCSLCADQQYIKFSINSFHSSLQSTASGWSDVDFFSFFHLTFSDFIFHLRALPIIIQWEKFSSEWTKKQSTMRLFDCVVGYWFAFQWMGKKRVVHYIFVISNCMAYCDGLTHCNDIRYQHKKDQE